MSKNSEMLVRIDERVYQIQKDVKSLRHGQEDIKTTSGEHNTRLAIIETEHKKPLHNGLGGFVLKILFGK